MSNIWKRSLSMFLALVMVFGMLPVNAFATETEEPVTDETVVTEPVETTQPTEAEEPAEEPEETTVATEPPVETTEETAAVEETEATEATEETVPVEAVEAVVEEELPKQTVEAVSNSAPEFTQADFVAAMEECLAEGGNEYILMQDVTITGEVEIYENIRVRIANGGSITVAENATLTVKGILWIADGSVTVNGTLMNNANPAGKGFIVDYGTENAVVTIGKTGEFINSSGYFRMDDGELYIEADEVNPDLRGKFTYESGALFLSSDVNLGADVEEIIGQGNIVYNIFADTEEELINGTAIWGDYRGKSLIVVGDVTLDEEADIDSGIISQIGYTNTRIGADHPGTLTLASGALLVVNNNMQVHGNGVINVAKGATLQNNSVIENLGTINASHNILGLENITGKPVVNERDAQSDLEDALAAAVGGDFELQETTSLVRDLTIDMQGGRFRIPAGVELIIPEGVTLTLESTMLLEGGLIVNGILDSFAGPGENEGLLADVGSNEAYLRVGATGTLANNGYLRMSAGELSLDGTYEMGGIVYISSDLALSSEHEAKIGKGNIIFDTFADTEEELINGAVIRDGYRGQNVIITGDVELTSGLELPESTQFYLQVGYTNTRSGVNIPGRLTLAPGTKLTVHNSLFVMNNAVMAVEAGAALENHGTIDNQGTITAVSNIVNLGDITGNPVENEKDAQGKFEDALANAAGGDYTLTEIVVLTRDLTINLDGGTLYIAEDGLLVISDGVTLTMESNLYVDGGKLVVQSGSTLSTINIWFNVGGGEVIFETGSNHLGGIDGNGDYVSWDTDTVFARYSVMNHGSGLEVGWQNYWDSRYSSFNMLPGEQISTLFGMKVWNSDTYEWKIIPIDPYDLVAGDYVTITRLVDEDFNVPIMGGDPCRDQYAYMRFGNVMDGDTSISYTYEGKTYSFNIHVGRPQQHGFYTAPTASDQTWIHTRNGFEVDPEAAENSFYYILTEQDPNWKIESFELRYSPDDPTPVTEATWEPTADPRVYKITVHPENIDSDRGSFPVHVNVYVSHPYNSDQSRWGIGQLWCYLPPSTEPHLAMRWLNNDGKGWYNPTEFDIQNVHLRAMDWMPVIFYWNVWDEDDQIWRSTPVLPTSDSENLTITRVKDLGVNNEIDNRIADKTGPIDKYVIVRTNGSLNGGPEELKVTINGKEYIQKVNVEPVAFAWYTENEISMDTFITAGGTEVQMNPFAEENVYYLKMTNPEKYQIWNSRFGTRVYDEATDRMVDIPMDKYVTMENLGNGTWKFTVLPEFVEASMKRWENFNLWAEFDYGNSNYGSRWHGELWVNPAEFHQPDAQFRINDVWCNYYKKFDAFVTWKPTGEYDEEGYEKHELHKFTLPKGVTYDYETNTITLSDATLSDLYFGYYWMDENGNPATGKNAGTDLPTDHLTLYLEGNNTISGSAWETLGIDRGLTLEITGSGSLRVKGEKKGEAGGAVWIGNDSHLVIGDNANVIVEIAGKGFWDDGTKARLAAITASDRNTSLTVTDDATLTTLVPTGSRRAEEDENGQMTHGYDGLADVRNILVEEGGTLNTQHICFWNGGSLTQTGGTIKIDDHGYTYYNEGEKGYHYCGIEMNGGTVDISGGTMTIDVQPATEEIPYSHVQGIRVIGGQMDISGGAMNIYSHTNGIGLEIESQRDSKDKEIKGSTLNISGGTLNVSGNPENDWAAITLSEKSKANFLGGEIVAQGARAYLHGNVVWGAQDGTGTYFRGGNASFNTYGPGTFKMYGGSVELENGDFEVNGHGTMYGGEINITNGMFRNNMSFGIEGGAVNITNMDIKSPGVENNMYLSVTDGELNVAANNEGTAFVNPGTFHQMGGNVTITNSSNADNVMDSWGQTLLNKGNLTLRGGTFGLIQGTDPDREADRDKTNDSMLQVQAGNLNISDCKVGILANGTVEFRKGSNVDINVSGEPDNDDESFARWPAGIFIINKKLYVESGSNVTLTSVDTAGVDAMSKGIVAWHNPVDIRGNVDIDAEMAIYSISATATNTNLNAGLHFWSDAAGGYLPVTTTKIGGSYLHTLMEGNEYAGQLKLSYDTAWTNGIVRECEDATSETTLINAVTSGAKEVYVSKNFTLTKALTIPSDVTVIIEEGITLTVNTRAAFVNNGTITVCQGAALNISSTKAVENYGQIEVYGGMNLSTSAYYGNNETCVYPIGYLNMTKGSIMGERICMIPGMDEEDIGSVTLPQMYRDFYYIKGVKLESFVAMPIDYTLDETDRIVVPVGSEVRVGVGFLNPVYAEHGIRYIAWASNSPEKDPLKVITSKEPGEVTVYAQALDENGNEIPVIDEFVVEFVEQDVIVTDNTTKEEIGTEPLEILTGNKVALKAAIDPNLTNASVVWELEGNGADYATLSVKSGVATVTAKTLTEKQDVVLIARANDNTAYREIKLQITPKVQTLQLWDVNSDNVTGKTITFDRNRMVAGVAQTTMFLQTNVAPLHASKDVTWKTTGFTETVENDGTEDGIKVWRDAKGILEIRPTDVEGKYEVTVLKTGKVTLTATTTDGSKKTAKVTINAVELLQDIESQKEDDNLIGGQSVTYYAMDGETKVKDTLVEWFLCDAFGEKLAEAHPYASITAKGKLTTKTVASPETIYIRAQVIGNEDAKTDKVIINLYPAVTQVKAACNDVLVDGTLYYDYANPTGMKLSVVGYPFNDAINPDKITWTAPSKSASIATIEADGTIIPNGGNGTVTFTGKAYLWNGTSKTVTVKVTFGTLVHDMVFYTWGNTMEEIVEWDNDAYTFCLNGNQGYMPLAMIDTLDREDNSVDVGLTFTVVDPALRSYLTINSKTGQFTTKNVNNPVDLQVAVTTADGYYTEYFNVMIVPARKSNKEALLLKFKDTNDYVTKTTLTGTIGTVYNLEAVPALYEAGEFDTFAMDSVTPWKSSNTSIATVDENGVVTIVGESSTKTATITAKAADGRTATVTVKGTRVSNGVTVTSKNGSWTVASGKTLTLVGTVAYTSGKTNTSVNWSVYDKIIEHEDGTVEHVPTTNAKISSTGVLTATANLMEPAKVYVIAAAKDGHSESAPMPVTILPLVTGVTILDDAGEDLNNTTMTLFVDEVMDLGAWVSPDDANRSGEGSVTWSSGSTKIAKIDKETGELTCVNTGTATITATAKDGSGKKATFKVTVARPMENATLAPLAEKTWGVGGGKTLKLASVIKIPSNVTNKKLTWEIIPSGDENDGAAYASISTAGVLTTKAVSEVKELTVQVTAAKVTSAITGDSAVTAECVVTIYPVTTALNIVEDGEVVNNKTRYVYLNETLDLSAVVKPADAWNDEDGIKWTSSKSSDASVDPQSGVVTGIKAGKTVTITAAAQDGSGKKATVKVKVLQPVERIEFHDNLAVGGGKTLKLASKVIFNEGQSVPTNKTLTWTLVDAYGEELKNYAYASINKTTGELKTKKVLSEKDIFVKAVSTDGTEIEQSCCVTIYPATTKMYIHREDTGANVTGKTLTLNAGDVVDFNVLTAPITALQDWTWKASNDKYLTVDAQTGEVTLLKSSGSSIVTITATANDSTGIKATFKVKVVQPVTSIDFPELGIAVNKTLRLADKVIFNENENAANRVPTKKTLKWELLEGDATLNTKGELKASTPQTVKVRATATDGSEVFKEFDVTVYPATTGMVITYEGESTVGQTITLNLEDETAQFAVDTTPDGAMQQWKWSSNNKTYLTVDANTGVVTLKKSSGRNTVTITAAAADGTTVKATVKVKVQ